MSVTAARRGDFGRGLSALGVIGIALNTILLGLDWISFDDRSNTQVLLLAASILGVFVGAWLQRSARAALAAVFAGVFAGALFLFAATFVAWLKSGYFFPARSRWLLRAALAAVLIAGAALGTDALRRRGYFSRSRP
jgi:hypothetical protein